jgi:hypothetical protein
MTENPNAEYRSKPSIKEAKRRHDLYFKGCALRTIASIAGAPLTRNEEDYWLNEQDNQEEVGRAITDPDLILKSKNIQETLHIITSSAVDSLVHFYTMLAKNASTPVGKSLSKLEAKWGVLSPNMIMQFSMLGSKVAVLEGSQDLDGHIFHIASTKEGGFVSLSDDNKPVILDKEKYLCIVFNPKGNK